MYLFEELFTPHSHDRTHQDHTHEDPHEHSHHIALIAFLAIFVHTIFDGMAIRAGMHLSETLSYALIFGVAIHQIPVSLSLAAIFKKSQLSKNTQILLMSLFAIAVALGFFLSSMLFGVLGPQASLIATAIAGGSLLYIASVDLLPMAHAENTKKSLTV